MPTDRSAAIAAVDDLMHARRWNVVDLAEEAGLDKGTVGDFLAGTRWPRPSTRGALEEAVGLRPGALGRIADGRSTPDQEMVRETPDPQRPVGYGLDDAAMGLPEDVVAPIRQLLLNIQRPPDEEQ